MAEDMQAQRKKDDVVDYVHESGVDRRASRSANVSSNEPEEERARRRREVDVHCRKQPGHYEKREHEAHVPVQPREQEASKEDFLKNRDEQRAAKDRDYAGERTLTCRSLASVLTAGRRADACH